MSCFSLGLPATKIISQKEVTGGEKQREFLDLVLNQQKIRKDSLVKSATRILVQANIPRNLELTPEDLDICDMAEENSEAESVQSIMINSK